ncbi:MAG: type IV pilus modification protein PilV [Peristeroidobacter soli]
MRTNVSRRRLGRQTGVTLVEIMVAVLVLSVGLLGLAGLQLRTLRNNQSALERGTAVVETYAIADAMRADRIGADNDRFNIALGAAAPTGTTFAATAVRSWRNNLIASLGDEATGSVDCDGLLCTISIRWNDSRGSEGSGTQTITTQVQL